MIAMADEAAEGDARVRSRRGQRRNPNVDRHDRAVVLATAKRLLEEEGVEALSVRRLARELGTSYQLVYTLFGGKQGLLGALFESGFESLEAACLALPPSDSAPGDLANLALVYRRFALEHRELYALMFGRDAGFEPSAASQRVALKSFQVVQACAARAFEASDAAQRSFPNGEALARAAWSTTHGHVALELASWFGSDAHAEKRLEGTVRALVGQSLQDEGQS